MMKNNFADIINVLMLIPWMEMGGADKFNLDVARLIDKQKFSLTIVCTMKAENQWRNLFEEQCNDIHVLPDFLKVEEYAEYIRSLILSKKIKVIFLSNSYYGYYIVPWLKVQFPQIAIVDYVHMAEWYWRNGGYARLSGMSGAFLNKTLVCNQATNDVLTNVFERRKETVVTLYIGVDDNKFNPEKIPYGKIREKYGIDNNKKVILFPCRIHPQKRPFLMIEIAKSLIENNKNIVFFVAGDGPQYEEMLEKIKKEKLQDFFVCPGEMSGMEYVYRDSDVTLICSLKEGLSLTAYESCAMMTPVITSDVGGQKELIDETVGKVLPMYQDERDIETRVYKQEEIQIYVDAIKELLKDEKKYFEMCNNCRKKITDRFSTNIMIEKLQEELQVAITQAVRENDFMWSEIKGLTENYLETYIELDNSASSLKYGQNMNEELKRIANSKWGKRVIKLMMKLKINRWFH